MLRKSPASREGAGAEREHSMNQRYRKGLPAVLALLALAGAAPPVSLVPADPRFAAAKRG